MLTTTKTARGWTIETDGVGAHGCLIAGATSGRRVLYTREQLSLEGISYDSDPSEAFTVAGASAAEYLWAQVDPERVLRRGHVVR